MNTEPSTPSHVSPVNIQLELSTDSPAQQVAFVDFPGLLLVRLMSRCNEKCLFCMVEDEIQQSTDVDYTQAVAQIEMHPPSTHIEFFGGEPTIYPRFLDLLTVARKRGHPCSVASNVRIFHSEKYTQSVAALGSGDIYIRTSLYGDSESLHDYYTATPRSYQQTTRGIQNIVQAGFACQVNIVILKENYQRLPEITRQVYAWGVRRIKFGNLIGLDTCHAHAAQLAQISPYLCEAIAVAEALGMKVTVEKTPICLIGGRVDLVSTERVLGQWPRVYAQTGACKACLVRPWCDGLDPEYARRFGLDELRSVESVPAAIVQGKDYSGEDYSSEHVDMMKVHCVMVESEQLNEYTATSLYQLLDHVQAKHGLLAIFPRKYIRF